MDPAKWHTKAGKPVMVNFRRKDCRVSLVLCAEAWYNYQEKLQKEFILNFVFAW